LTGSPFAQISAYFFFPHSRRLPTWFLDPTVRWPFPCGSRQPKAQIGELGPCFPEFRSSADSASPFKSFSGFREISPNHPSFHVPPPRGTFLSEETVKVSPHRVTADVVPVGMLCEVAPSFRLFLPRHPPVGTNQHKTHTTFTIHDLPLKFFGWIRMSLGKDRVQFQSRT